MQLLKKTGLAISLIALAAAPLFAGENRGRQNPQEEIERANGEFAAAFARGDAKAVAAMYTEQGQLFPPNQPIVEGRVAIESFWRGVMNAGAKGVALKTMEIESFGDTIVETGSATVFGADAAVLDKGKYVVIWKRSDGRWHLHRDCWNSNEPVAR